MAITNAQRSIALQAIVQAALGQNVYGMTLAQLLPGATPANVLSTLVTFIGTQADSYFTTTLSNIVAALNAQVAAENNAITGIQSEITAATVV